MSNAGRQFLGLQTHTMGFSPWSQDEFYNAGDLVQFGGSLWQAVSPVAKGHAPQGVGDGSTADRQLLLDQLTNGFGGMSGVTGGGLAAPTYTVNSTDDTNTGTATSGTLRHALNGITTPLWIVFDKTVFPKNAPVGIDLVSSIETAPNKTIDGRGAGVVIRKNSIIHRSDSGAALVGNRGNNTANIIVAYIGFTDQGGSVLVFGGVNPWSRGGGDKVYLHHLSVYDTEDQMMSNSNHAYYLSRSTIDWSKFGPSPASVMTTSMRNGSILKLFSIDATDKANNTITALDAAGNPTQHGIFPPFEVRFYKRTNLVAHPFPVQAEFLPGADFAVRSVGLAGATLQTFTADSSTDTLTCPGHGYSNGQAVVLANSGTLPAGLRYGFLYYVRNATVNDFQLQTPISNGNFTDRTFTSNGSGTLQVQLADLTKFQISPETGFGTWNAVDLTDTGGGFYTEDTEPLWYNNGKGPQWGNHHADDLIDGMAPYLVDSASSTFTVPAHGQVDGAQVRFWSQSVNLPGNITQGTTYYIRDTTPDTFRLSATLGGGLLSLSNDGMATVAFNVDAAGVTSKTITTVDGGSNPTAHGLSAGDMVAIAGSSRPSGLDLAQAFWVTNVVDANNIQIATRKGDPAMSLGSTGSGTLIKKTPVVQFLQGANKASIALCDFQYLKIRSPKLQAGHYHLWNNRNYKWGEPAIGGNVGGIGNEIADGGQVLIENSIYTPYDSSGTEVHYWSNFTLPHEDIYATEPSKLGVNIDSGAYGAVDPSDWAGGAAVILSGLLMEDGVTTRNAPSGTIVNSPSLEWYNGTTLPVPYDYTKLDVQSDPSELKLILDRGAGNVQPWIKIG